jgi:hypothetical protein
MNLSPSPVTVCQLGFGNDDRVLQQNQTQIDSWLVACKDENGTEVFRIDRFRFLYYGTVFNMKNYQFQLVS